MHLLSITIPLHCIQSVVFGNKLHFIDIQLFYQMRVHFPPHPTPSLLWIVMYHPVQCWLLQTLPVYILSFIVINLHGLSSYYQHNRFCIFGSKSTFAFYDFNHVLLHEMCCITKVIYALTIYFYCNRRPFINHRTESISLVRIKWCSINQK